MNTRFFNNAQDPVSCGTHAIGAAAAFAGGVIYLFRAVGEHVPVLALAAAMCFCLSMIALYSASAIYHFSPGDAKTQGVKSRLRKLDHCSICLLIAGSYTPICLLTLKGPWGWTLFGLIWTMAAAGIALSILWINAPRWLSAGVYLAMGWLAIIAIYPLSKVLSAYGMVLLVLGGVLYTIGGVLYGLKWPGRNNPRFGCHEIFHVFILAGSIVHFLMMYQVVMFS